jgi:hypothetical protein
MKSKILDEVFTGVGYAVVKADDIVLMEQVRDLMRDATSAKLDMPRDWDVIRRKLCGLSEAEINGLGGIPDDEVLRTILKAFKNSIVEISGSNLFVQRSAFLTVNVSNKADAKGNRRRVPSVPHIEAMCGISPHTMSLWAPLHDIDDDTGIWLIDQHQSIDLLNKEKTVGRVMGENILDINSSGMRNLTFIRLVFGEAIIFNPFCLHGSVSNMTDLTRICVNLRFQSQSERLFLKSSEFFTPYDLN